MLVDGLRDQDVAELDALGQDPVTGLHTAVETSRPNAFAAMDDGHPVSLFGVSPLVGDASGQVGVPWMLSSDGLFRIVREFVRQAPLWVDHLNDIYPLLVNWVDERNTVSVRWLKRMGFIFDGITTPSGDTNFLRFYRSCASRF